MSLKEWIESEGRRVDWLAGELECRPSTIWRWTTGRSKPSLHFRRSIERITDGAVPLSAWAGSGDEERGAA